MNTLKKILLLSPCIAGFALSGHAIESNLRYYKELNTLAEAGLNGKVKKVVTYNVPFTREWGEIKYGQPEARDSLIYDADGRLLFDNRYLKRTISWSGNSHTVIIRGDYLDSSVYDKEIYEYSYDSRSRLISVTEKRFEGMGSSSRYYNEKNSKVFFSYPTSLNGYTATVYESIDSDGSTYKYSDINDPDPHARDRNSDEVFDEDWEVKYDAAGNWIEAKRYERDYDNSKALTELKVRRIEYYRPGETASPSIPNTPFALESIVENGPGEPLIYDPQPVKSPSLTDEEDDKVYTSADKMPQYPGGDAALMADLSKNLRYPMSAQENGIEGIVVVQFVVSKTGMVGEVKVVRGKNPVLDKEACRVAKTLKKFAPATINGKPVNVWYTIPIAFRLPH